MTKRSYRIIPQKHGRAFDVEMTESPGATPCIVNTFNNEADAWQWLNEQEQAEIKSEAERKEIEAKQNFRRHEVFARGVTMFQIAIAIAAISALTKKRRFWLVSLIFGAVGCFFLFTGLIAR